jgi:hypothetical protein
MLITTLSIDFRFKIAKKQAYFPNVGNSAEEEESRQNFTGRCKEVEIF